MKEKSEIENFIDSKKRIADNLIDKAGNLATEGKLIDCDKTLQKVAIKLAEVKTLQWVLNND